MAAIVAELIGLGIVGWDYHSTARGVKSVLEADPPKPFDARLPLIGHFTTKFNVGDPPPLHERVTLIEEALDRLGDSIDTAVDALRRDLREDIRRVVAAEETERRRDVEAVREAISEATLAGMRLRWIGLGFILLGLIFTSIGVTLPPLGPPGATPGPPGAT